ncbi:DUF2232 domain-containing protein [Metaclostridioides mangenotii]|uniref:DUF2232 domain-containing protein n=1 Tax=Metaclostridioides mangenotii TaxID=1540 RepID=UPI0028E3B7E8|nr:DUF2232 domain-containing protein [Clostridioides mangenotii]
MEIKIRPSQLLGVVFLTIALAAIFVYIPVLSLFSPLIAVTYVLVGAKNNVKLTVQAVIITFIMLWVSVDISYTLNICITFMLPGILIGKMINTSFKDENADKLVPIFWGSIIFLISTIIYFSIVHFAFKIDLMSGITQMIEEQIKAMDMESSNLIFKNIKGMESISADEVMTNFLNFMPIWLIAQNIMYSFIVYYLSIFAMNRINKKKLESAKFTEIFLPGHAVWALIFMYISILILDVVGLKMNKELIILNLFSAFAVLFLIQAISLYAYYIKNLSKNGLVVCVLLLVLFLAGILGATVIGMFDCVLDFRKVKSNKST